MQPQDATPKTLLGVASWGKNLGGGLPRRPTVLQPQDATPRRDKCRGPRSIMRIAAASGLGAGLQVGAFRAPCGDSAPRPSPRCAPTWAASSRQVLRCPQRRCSVSAPADLLNRLHRSCTRGKSGRERADERHSTGRCASHRTDQPCHASGPWSVAPRTAMPAMGLRLSCVQARTQQQRARRRRLRV